MFWYYAQGSDRLGPVEQEDFDRLVAEGRITDSTLVWHENMPNWREWGAQRALAVAAPGEPDGLAPVRSACVQCKGIFPTDDMVRVKDVYVCGACKPGVLQMLREGLPLPGQMLYAGFWIRVAASIIDGFVLWIINMAIQTPIMAMIGTTFSPDSMGFALPFMLILVYGVPFGIMLLYETLFVGRFAATPGKMACRIKIVTADGGKMSYARSLGRAAAKMLNALTCGLSYLLVAFDSQKRGIHDFIDGSRVIHR